MCQHFFLAAFIIARSIPGLHGSGLSPGRNSSSPGWHPAGLLPISVNNTGLDGPIELDKGLVSYYLGSHWTHFCLRKLFLNCGTVTLCNINCTVVEILYCFQFIMGMFTFQHYLAVNPFPSHSNWSNPHPYIFEFVHEEQLCFHPRFIGLSCYWVNLNLQGGNIRTGVRG